jgi:hypothetical protein
MQQTTSADWVPRSADGEDRWSADGAAETAERARESADVDGGGARAGSRNHREASRQDRSRNANGSRKWTWNSKYQSNELTRGPYELVQHFMGVGGGGGSNRCMQERCMS